MSYDERKKTFSMLPSGVAAGHLSGEPTEVEASFLPALVWVHVARLLRQLDLIVVLLCGGGGRQERECRQRREASPRLPHHSTSTTMPEAD